MFKIMLVYGAISGATIIALMLIGMQFGQANEWFGYLSMLVVLSLIFVGVKRYRDRALGGVIRFVPALGLGMGIAAVAGVFYVLSWELSLYLTDYAFIDTYTNMMTASYQAKNLGAEELAAKLAEVETMMTNYRNPLFRLPMTFLEMFPVGAVVALISAAFLRNPKVLPARS